MSLTEKSTLLDLSDATLLSEDIKWRLDWCDSINWGYYIWGHVDHEDIDDRDDHDDHVDLDDHGDHDYHDDQYDHDDPKKIYSDNMLSSDKSYPVIKFILWNELKLGSMFNGPR